MCARRCKYRYFVCAADHGGRNEDQQKILELGEFQGVDGRLIKDEVILQSVCPVTPGPETQPAFYPLLPQGLSEEVEVMNVIGPMEIHSSPTLKLSSQRGLCEMVQLQFVFEMELQNWSENWLHHNRGHLS